MSPTAIARNREACRLAEQEAQMDAVVAGLQQSAASTDQAGSNETSASTVEPGPISAAEARRRWATHRAALAGRQGTRAATSLPLQLSGSFYASVRRQQPATDGSGCVATDVRRLSLNVAPSGSAQWRGYTHVDVACPNDSERHQPLSCWVDGEGVVEATRDGRARLRTRSKNRAPGPVATEYSVWECDGVRLEVPRAWGAVSDVLRRRCVAMGNEVDSADQRAAAIQCAASDLFPELDDAALTPATGALVVDLGLVGPAPQPVELARIGDAPSLPPPDRFCEGAPSGRGLSRREFSALRKRVDAALGRSLTGEEYSSPGLRHTLFECNRASGGMHTSIDVRLCVDHRTGRVLDVDPGANSRAFGECVGGALLGVPFKPQADAYPAFSYRVRIPTSSPL